MAATIKAKQVVVIPSTLRSEFQKYFVDRRKTTDGLEPLVVKYMTQTLPDWRQSRLKYFGRIQAHLKPFWPELWAMASISMTEEEFQVEQAGLLRCLEFDVSLYFVKHRYLTDAKLRTIVTQVGAGPEKRNLREAAAARLIRSHNQDRHDSRQEAMREARDGQRAATKQARASRADAKRIRGVLQTLVESGKVDPAEIPTPEESDSPSDLEFKGSQDLIMAALLSKLEAFDLTPEGDRVAFVHVFSSLVSFFEHPDFKDRFGATQYRDYWFSAYRLFKEGIQAHKIQMASASARA